MTWTKLCEKNLNHYNDHPVRHTAFTAVYALGVVVGVSVLARKLAEPPKNPYLV